METIRRAVIDVGTNSIKLLVADVSGRNVQPVHEESRQTRLGKGFYETHQLQPESIARTAEAVAEFERIAREQNSTSTRVIATSAARDAVNPRELTVAIERASGLKTEIISGGREAEWAFLICWGPAVALASAFYEALPKSAKPADATEEPTQTLPAPPPPPL